MSNEFETVVKDIGTGVKDAAEAVAHEAVKIVTFAEKADKVIGTLLSDQPQAKLVLTTFLQKCTTLEGDVATAVADKGINLSADSEAVADIESAASYFSSTVVPFIEATYAALSTDVSA